VINIFLFRSISTDRILMHINLVAR